MPSQMYTRKTTSSQSGTRPYVSSLPCLVLLHDACEGEYDSLWFVCFHRKVRAYACVVGG